MLIENELVIEAPVDDIWALTIDVEGWPPLTTSITNIQRLDDGPLGVGSKAAVKQPWQSERTWTVTTFEPPRRFEWATHVLGTRMVAIHELSPEGDGCRNRLAIELTGWSSRILGALIGRQIAKGIATENAGFKRQAERVA